MGAARRLAAGSMPRVSYRHCWVPPRSRRVRESVACGCLRAARVSDKGNQELFDPHSPRDHTRCDGPDTAAAAAVARPACLEHETATSRHAERRKRSPATASPLESRIRSGMAQIGRESYRGAASGALMAAAYLSVRAAPALR